MGVSDSEPLIVRVRAVAFCEIPRKPRGLDCLREAVTVEPVRSLRANADKADTGVLEQMQLTFHPSWQVIDLLWELRMCGFFDGDGVSD